MPTRTTVPTVPAAAADPNPGSLRADLRRRLLSLNFHAFCQCLCLLLTELGYEEARPAGRTNWKGRNRGGGYDIEAWLPGGLTRRKVVAVAKQFDGLPVYQRMIDELRGTALRTGASEALLITTSTFSPVALLGQAGQAGQANETGSSPAIAPVRLIDGDELLDLLLAHGIGVREESTGVKQARLRRLYIDEEFFDGLARACPGNSRGNSRSGRNSRSARSVRCTDEVRHSEARPLWRVTVQVAGGSPDHRKRSTASCGDKCGGTHGPSRPRKGERL
jgi:hypothetical protein